jgi:sugar O-acyltransferase (sialic acid O-acetyltransferase NeuD family)
MSNMKSSKEGIVLIKCVILGGGGHTKGLIDAIFAAKMNLDIVGILDPDNEKWGKEIQGIEVIGGDELLKSMFAEGVQSFIVGLGGAGDCKPRMRLYQYALETGLNPLSVIHPTAYISPFAELGNGAQVMPRVTVMPSAKIADDVILNTNAIIEHDCLVGSHSHISSGAHLAGNIRIGICSHIGIGAVIKEGINIDDHVIVGAGAVVVKDIPANMTVVGNPATILQNKY